MTDCQMPVLTEQEKEDLKKFILLAKDESKPNYPIEEIKKYMRLSMQIALASLTAELLEGICYQGQCLYLAPPVPVIKQEGDKRD